MQRIATILSFLFALSACTGGPPLAPVSADHPASPQARESAYVMPANVLAEDPAPPEQSAAAHADRATMAMDEANAPPKTATGTGIVKSVRPSDHVVEISHEAIKDLGWPPMTMSFPVAKDVPIKDISPGNRIVFTLRPGPDGVYEIIAIKPAGAESAPGKSGGM